MTPPRHSVLIAARNEAEAIEHCIRRVYRALGDSTEVIVIDGGTDATPAIVDALREVYPRLVHVAHHDDRGKGHAIRTGMSRANGDYIMQIDADLQFLPEELPRIVEPLIAGRADLVLGSRFKRDASCHRGSTPALRTIGNHVTSGFASFVMGHRMSDVTAGMKAWTKRANPMLRPRSDRYSYEVELPIRALRLGLRVEDVAVTTVARQTGQSHVHVVRDGLRFLADIARFRLGAAYGQPFSD